MRDTSIKHITWIYQKGRKDTREERGAQDIPSQRNAVDPQEDNNLKESLFREESSSRDVIKKHTQVINQIMNRKHGPRDFLSCKVVLVLRARSRFPKHMQIIPAP